MTNIPKYVKGLVLLGYCFVGSCWTLNAQPNQNPAPGLQAKSLSNSKPSAQPTIEKYARLPLSFERASDSEFIARGQGYMVDVRGSRASIAVQGAAPVGLEFARAAQGAAVPEDQLPGKVNYIRGNDARRWKLGLPTYKRVVYHEVYPGIDVVYYGNQTQLEFDLVLKPGADPSLVRLRFAGSAKPQTDPSGSLLIGNLQLLAPSVFQAKRTIPARYKILTNDEVGFEVGAYDRSQALTIDPTLVYSTQLGGGNQFNRGNAIALDAGGNAYIAGITYADDFPVRGAAFGGYSANGDGFISKVNSTGSAIVYSTYLGGSGSDSLQAIAVDSTGAVWAVGGTNSTDFPLLNPFQSALKGSNDAVIVKLSPSGSLAYSTLLGGTGYDTANAVALDPAGNAYVAGRTDTGFPTTAGVYQTGSPGGIDGFVTKFSPAGVLLWSTLAGGAGSDIANGIAVDNFGNTYITGQTFSTSFPNAPAGGAQTANHGGGDAFVAKLNFNGSALIYFTFLGGSGGEQASAVGVDPLTGIAVVAGQTTSADLPTTAGTVQAASAGGSDGFVAKLNAAGSVFLYTTYLGGNHSDVIQGLAMDSSGSVYVTGSTNSSTFPVASAIQASMQGNSTSLFRTSDTGATWTPLDANLPGAAYDISPDPSAAGTIVVSTETGVYRTTNGGASWTQQSSAGFLGLSRSPANLAIIYGYNCNAYQSTDNGVTWNFKGNTSPICSNRIVADALNPVVAYAYGPPAVGVLKTINNGVTWNPAITGLPANQSVGKMATASDGSVYVALRSTISGAPSLGIYKSSNQAASWTAVNTGLSADFPFGDLAAGPANTLYVTDFFSLYQSTNGGAQWNRTGSLPTAFVGCIPNTLGISAFNPAVAYWSPCYFGWAIAPLTVTSTIGASWTPASGLGAATINKIVGDPVNAGVAYALSALNNSPFVAKIDPTGKTLLYSTYLGDTGAGAGVATNGAGEAYVTGFTSSKAFPVTPLKVQGNNPISPQTEVFVTRISDATAACSFSVSPQPYLTGPYESAVFYSVVAPSGCPWTASSNQGWASILSGAAGSGTGVVTVLMNVNSTDSTRTATLSIAGQAVTLNQLPTSCNPGFSLNSFTVPPGGLTFSLGIAAGSSCAWNVLNNDPNAITVVSGGSGTGNGTVTLTVEPNRGPNTRTLTVSIQQGNSVTISQAGTTAPAIIATVTSAPSGAAVAVTGSGCIPGIYSTPANLTWNANTNCTVAFITPQTIGGAQYVFSSATVNGGSATTNNPLTVNSGSAAVSIAATFITPCTYSLSPTGQSFGAAGGADSFSVTTPAACSWGASSSADWITILPGGSKGPGKVNYAVAANNTGVSRAGFVSVAGQHFDLTQAGYNCSNLYFLQPSLDSLGNAGGTTSVLVDTPPSCPWTATSNVAWLTVISGASGSGNGTVMVRAASNSGGARTGTVTIAGQAYTVKQSGSLGPDACGALDITSQVSVTRSSLTPVPFSTLYSQSITVRNGTGSTIPGPVYVVLLGEPTHVAFPDNSFLLSGGPTTSCFSTPGDYLLPISGGLAPGQTVGAALAWTTQSRLASINYSIKVLSGTPSH